MPNHHPEPEELLAYATGASEEWLSALIACHLTLCPACRGELRVLETLGGALFDELPAVEGLAAGSPPPHSDPSLPAGRAGEQRTASSNARVRPAIPDAIARQVPRPLHAFFADREPAFRFRAPGLSHIPLQLAGGGRPIRLVKFKPGFVIPEHAHDGLEWLLVLSGELRDTVTGECYRRGDVSRRDVDDVHSQVISKEEPCVAVFANIGRPIPRTLTGRVLARIVGL